MFLVSHCFSFDCLESPSQFIYLGLKQFSIRNICLWIFMTFLASASQLHHKTRLFPELSTFLSTRSWNGTESRQIHCLWAFERNALITKPDMKRYNWLLNHFLCYKPSFTYTTDASEMFLGNVFLGKRVKLSASTNLEAISFWLQKRPGLSNYQLCLSSTLKKAALQCSRNELCSWN